MNVFGLVSMTKIEKESGNGRMAVITEMAISEH